MLSSVGIAERWRRLRPPSLSPRLVVAAAVATALVAGVLLSSRIAWRAEIVVDRATGRITDIDWGDLLLMLRPRSGFYLERLAETRNPFEVISSPYRTPSDLADGERLFRENCSPCHGEGGIGGVGGPSLFDRAFRQGRSEWALYRTITRGIPGTAMAGHTLPRKQTWRLVSYLSHQLTAARDVVPVVAVAGPPQPLPVTPGEIREASPAEWLTYSGSYDGHRHTALGQIDRDNIATLRVEWERQFATTADRIETSPIVRGSRMYVSEPPNRVHALNAATGEVLWTFSRDMRARMVLCCGPANRGVAVLGDRVYVGTLDAHLIALDAATGKPVWDVKVADNAQGYSITGAPLVIDDMVITGISGGEFGARGFIDAYDATTGQRRWRFYTVPAPGEPGSDTWSGNSAAHGGGPTWLTGSYDPELHLLYWGVGNPSPNFYGEGRRGDNLYTDSVVALDPETGELRWHFQFTPHDLHDWDAVQVPILVDASIDGVPRKLMAWANRNAFYYLLDRETGKFLVGAPFVRQNWADGLDDNGRPRVRPESVPTRQGAVVYPSVTGATNWWSSTYDPALRLVYVPTVDRATIFYGSADQPADADRQVLGGGFLPVPDELLVPAIKAIDVTTGQLRWQHQLPPRSSHAELGGLLSSAGGLVFGGSLEAFFALDSETGSELWHFESGGHIAAAPISYEIDGRQFVAVAAGRSLIAFALPRTAAKTSLPSSSQHDH